MFGKKANDVKQRRSSSRRRPSRRKQPPSAFSFKRIALGTVIMLVPAVILGVGGRLTTVSTAQVAMNKDTHCFDTVTYDAVPVLIDYATTNLFASDNQLLSLETAFLKQAKALKANQRLDVFTTAKETIADVVKPVFSTCMPPATTEDLQLLAAIEPNIQSVTQAYLNTEREKAIKKVDAEIKRLIADSQARKYNVKERWNSPIMEQARSISIHYTAGSVKHFLVFSSGIQVSESLYFCGRAGDLPRFENFKRNYPLYEQLKLLDGFQGTQVMFLMPRVLDRHYIGDHCTFEELYNWWPAYFKDGGAADVFVQPLQYELSLNNNVGSFGMADIVAAALIATTLLVKARV